MSVIEAEGLKVTPSEATEFCVHHLRLAFSMYLSSEGDTPDENMTNLRLEVKRQCDDRGAADWELTSVMAFLNAANTYDRENA